MPAPEALADMRQRLGDLIHDGGDIGGRFLRGEDPVEEENLGKNDGKMGFEMRLNGVFMRFTAWEWRTTCESNGNTTPIHFSWGYNRVDSSGGLTVWTPYLMGFS